MPLVVDDGSALDHHFDHLPDLHHSSILELSDGGSGPRTPPALLTPAQLPADPKQAIWPYPSAPNHHLLKKKSNKNQPHMHTPTPPAAAAPTISTFSASNLNHIHIVQPYVHAGAQNPSPDKAPTPSNACTTSTFSVHQPPASSTSQFSVANPYCTNELHSYLPSPGSAATTASGQPPRPANAWILYRSDKMKDIAPAPGQPRPPQADISKLIAAMWKNESPDVRQRYEELSDVKKAQHLALYPGYRFQPMKKADREKMRAEKRAEKEREKLSQLSLKTYRKPKSKRGMTEDSLPDITSPTTGSMPWQNADAAPISPLSARGHAFSYQPYALPSPTTPTTPGAAPVKRKRAKTKVEVQTPAIPAEEPRAEYVPEAGHYFDSRLDYASYTPQLSTSSSDPNLHQIGQTFTPPEGRPHIQGDAYQANGTTNPVPVTLESVGVFDIANLDITTLGQDIQISLPEDFDWNTAGGFGGFEGLVMEGGLGDLAGFSGGFAEFSDMVNLDALAANASGMDGSQLGPGLLDGVDMGMGDYEQGMVDPSSLNYPTSTGSMQYADSTFTMTSSTSNTTAGVTPSHVHAPHLSISTQSLHSAVTSPVVETPHSATSQFGSFAIHPQTYSHQHQLHHHQHSHSGRFMSPQSFQSLVSPTQSHFASPPPGSVVDENEGYAPSNAALTGRVTRETVTSWR